MELTHLDTPTSCRSPFANDLVSIREDGAITKRITDVQPIICYLPNKLQTTQERDYFP